MNNMKYFISICAAFAIIGCGTDSNLASQDGGGGGGAKVPTKPVQNSYVDKGGLSGQVYMPNVSRMVNESKVCFDTNANGICDNGEDFEKIYEEGKFSFAKNISDANKDQILVANIKNENFITTLSSYESNITPYTTLVVNETLYNPNANKDKNKAKELLKVKFSDESLLNGAMPNQNEAKELYETFKKAGTLNIANSLDAIANAVDNIYKQNTNTPELNAENVIAQTQIQTQGAQELKITSEDPSKILRWTKTHVDETQIGFSTNKNFALTHSKWHNSLRIIDKNTSSIVLESKFIYVDAEKEEIDTSTGASEQLLYKVLIDDENNIYGLTIVNGGDSVGPKPATRDGGGNGVYKVSLQKNADTYSIPDTQLVKVQAGANAYRMPDGKDMALNKDTLAIIGNELVTLNKNTLEKLKSIDLQAEGTAVAMSDKYIFAGTYKERQSEFRLYDKDLNQLDSININTFLDSNGKNRSVTKIATNGEYIAVQIATQYRKTFLYKVENNKLMLVRTLTVNPRSGAVSNISFTDDNKYLLVSTLGKNVEIYNVDDFSKKIDQPTAGYVPFGAYIKDDKIGISAGSKQADTGVFFYYDITKTSAQNVDAAAWANAHR